MKAKLVKEQMNNTSLIDTTKFWDNEIEELNNMFENGDLNDDEYYEEISELRDRIEYWWEVEVNETESDYEEAFRWHSDWEKKLI